MTTDPANPTNPTVDRLPPLPESFATDPAAQALAAAVSLVEPARAAGVTPPAVRAAISPLGDAPVRIGRAVLPPFDLDRQLLLEEIASPLVTPGKDPTARDLVYFLYVCEDADRAWADFAEGGCPTLHARATASRLGRDVTLADIPRILAYLNPGLPDSGKVTGQAAANP